MEFTSLELNSSIENLRERSLSVVESTKSAVDRTQRATTEWLADNERKLLTGLLDALREVEARIQRRLELLGQAPVEAPAEGPADETGAREAVALPIEDYDLYTAKEIIAELTALSGDAAQAILEYEKAHKARATVIRAAEQKLLD